MEVKEAIQKAKTEIITLFSDEDIRDLGLEEVEAEDGGWAVTLGFRRVTTSDDEDFFKHSDTPLTDMIRANQWHRANFRRVYKIVHLDKHGGLKAVKDREV